MGGKFAGKTITAIGRVPFWLGLMPQRAILEALKTQDPPFLVATIFWNFALIGIAGLFITFGKRVAATDARPLIKQAQGRVLLYLRSFRSDEASISAGRLIAATVMGSPMRFFVTAEERLAEILGDVGPFVALGRPGEALPTLGAARLYVADEEWRSEVESLLGCATAVVFRAGTTSNYWDEVRMAVRKARPESILFWFPESSREAYELFCKQAHGYIPCTLPEVDGKPLFLYFKHDWSPVLVHRRTSIMDVMLASIFDPGIPYGIERCMQRSIVDFFDQNDLPAPRDRLRFNSFVLLAVLILILFSLPLILLMRSSQS